LKPVCADVLAHGDVFSLAADVPRTRGHEPRSSQCCQTWGNEKTTLSHHQRTVLDYGVKSWPEDVMTLRTKVPETASLEGLN